MGQRTPRSAETEYTLHNVQINIDREHGLASIRVDGAPIADTEELEPGLLVDRDERGVIVAVEIMFPPTPEPEA